MEDGIVTEYDVSRGFGFVRPRTKGAEDVFVHASTVSGGVALHAGQRVRFEAQPSPKGPRAVRVEPGRRGLSPAMVGGLALFGAIGAGVVGLLYERVPVLWAWLGAVNPVTFFVFALDKRRAGGEGRRVPERVLLGLTLVGGTLGAAVAMTKLRHKTRKIAFLVPFIGIVLLQVAVVAWWVWRRQAG